MEAFCELFFDNLATLLGVTGAAMVVQNVKKRIKPAYPKR